MVPKPGGEMAERQATGGAAGAAPKWTDSRIRAAKLARGRSEQRIAIEEGLFLRMRAGAGGLSKSFEYRAMVNGARKYLTLGAYSDRFGLAAARAKLTELRGIAGQARIGEADHPVIEERFRREGRKSDPTFAELFDAFTAERRLGSARKGGRPVRERTIEIHRGNFDSDIRGRIGDAKVGKVKRDALQACINAARRRGSPGQAAQVYRTLRALVRFAIQQGHTIADPMAGIENPKPYRPPRTAEEVNAASDKDLLALFRVLGESRVSEPVRLAIEFQLLTGARPSEVRQATWGEIKGDRWLIPAERSKSDRPFEVHLSDAALAVLARARKLPKGKRAVRGEGIILANKGEPLDKMAVARALARIATRVIEAGGRKLRPHDLRRTTRTIMSRIGIAPHVAERCLNHLDANVLARVYDGHDHRPAMIEAWDKVGAHLSALRLGGAEVVALRG